MTPGRSRNIIWPNFLFLPVFGSGGQESSSKWQHMAMMAIFLCVCMLCILMYTLKTNKRLKQRLMALEQLCFEHGITKNKQCHYTLSSDDEYDELNPFITKSEIEDMSNKEIKDDEYANIDKSGDDDSDHQSYQQIDE